MQKKITISFNAEQIAYLESLLGAQATGERIKTLIEGLPDNKKSGRPKGAKNK